MNNMNNVTTVSDAIAVQLKDLAIQLGTAGVKYTVDWLIDLIVPTSTIFEVNNDAPVHSVTRSITVQDGTKFNIKVDISKEELKKALKLRKESDDAPDSESEISAFTSLVYEKETSIKSKNGMFTVTVSTDSALSGSFSLMGGVLGITW